MESRHVGGVVRPQTVALVQRPASEFIGSIFKRPRTETRVIHLDWFFAQENGVNFRKMGSHDHLRLHVFWRAI
jgi:hypothetical protein